MLGREKGTRNTDRSKYFFSYETLSEQQNLTHWKWPHILGLFRYWDASVILDWVTSISWSVGLNKSFIKIDLPLGNKLFNKASKSHNCWIKLLTLFYPFNSPSISANDHFYRFTFSDTTQIIVTNSWGETGTKPINLAIIKQLCQPPCHSPLNWVFPPRHFLKQHLDSNPWPSASVLRLKQGLFRGILYGKKVNKPNQKKVLKEKWN